MFALLWSSSKLAIGVPIFKAGRENADEDARGEAAVVVVPLGCLCFMQ
jgi:hypothetical protein